MSTSSATTEPTRVTVDDVARRFGRRWALARIQVDLTPGAATMITGPNGSGKTTLLRCLATALKPHHGRILVDGADLWSERARLRRRISFLSHQTRLYEDLSAAENLRVWARLGGFEADVPALLDRVDLPSDRNDPVRTFSAGMRRRLSLAVTLLKRPALALFDEPFSAMDPEGQALVRDVVRELAAGGATVAVTTHLPQMAAHCCTAAIHLEAGRLVWTGTSAEAVARAEA